MGTPNYPKDMSSEWNQMKRDVKNAFTSANLRTGMAKIGAKVIEITGSLIMNAGAMLAAKYTNNVNALWIGKSSYNGQEVGQIAMRRYDDTVCLQVFGGENEAGFFSIQDRNGSIIVSDDGVTGQGLARPWLPYEYVRTSALTNPVDKSTSTTFAPHHTTFGYQQHPRITVFGFLWMAAGDSGEVRIFAPGSSVVVATSGVVTGSKWVTLEGPHDGYVFGDFFQYDIEVRRSAGAGTGVGFTPVMIYGKQS